MNIDLDEVSEKAWKENGPAGVVKIAEHYGIFKDLFPGAFFYLSVNLDVCYHGDDSEIPVFYGNQLFADEVQL